ncbi:hypothetical protein CEUSTIGMA_g11579.t1 [Chlamydomonas eustigma]|uniref:Guanylate cyclase domain-containing protein n=1 Tax=Chlamydomonas eustigma TaxID=1157962 RepID=A0A250XMB4_9CHLO|nr:hypothetical protein CEUSTIGMA_g11579.t1 [Chlamydomonas eustigma]|eukprot:GAX84156.1 hypothetical protein CEUSTIGMA_g11579.t1 [Chlamydomonas eustigma]
MGAWTSCLHHHAEELRPSQVDAVAQALYSNTNQEAPQQSKGDNSIRLSVASKPPSLDEGRRDVAVAIVSSEEHVHASKELLHAEALVGNFDNPVPDIKQEAQKMLLLQTKGTHEEKQKHTPSNEASSLNVVHQNSKDPTEGNHAISKGQTSLGRSASFQNGFDIDLGAAGAEAASHAMQVLAEISSLVTVIDLTADAVVYQNTHSTRYWGSLTSHDVRGHQESQCESSAGNSELHFHTQASSWVGQRRGTAAQLLLKYLLSAAAPQGGTDIGIMSGSEGHPEGHALNAQMLADVLHCVQSGAKWRGDVYVPASMVQDRGYSMPEALSQGNKSIHEQQGMSQPLDHVMNQNSQWMMPQPQNLRASSLSFTQYHSLDEALGVGNKPAGSLPAGSLQLNPVSDNSRTEEEVGGTQVSSLAEHRKAATEPPPSSQTTTVLVPVVVGGSREHVSPSASSSRTLGSNSPKVQEVGFSRGSSSSQQGRFISERKRQSLARKVSGLGLEAEDELSYSEYHLIKELYTIDDEDSDSLCDIQEEDDDEEEENWSFAQELKLLEGGSRLLAARKAQKHAPVPVAGATAPRDSAVVAAPEHKNLMDEESDEDVGAGWMEMARHSTSSSALAGGQNHSLNLSTVMQTLNRPAVDARLLNSYPSLFNWRDGGFASKGGSGSDRSSVTDTVADSHSHLQTCKDVVGLSGGLADSGGRGGDNSLLHEARMAAGFGNKNVVPGAQDTEEEGGNVGNVIVASYPEDSLHDRTHITHEGQAGKPQLQGEKSVTMQPERDENRRSPAGIGSNAALHDDGDASHLQERPLMLIDVAGEQQLQEGLHVAGGQQGGDGETPGFRSHSTSSLKANSSTTAINLLAAGQSNSPCAPQPSKKLRSLMADMAPLRSSNSVSPAGSSSNLGGFSLKSRQLGGSSEKLMEGCSLRPSLSEDKSPTSSRRNMFKAKSLSNSAVTSSTYSQHLSGHASLQNTLAACRTSDLGGKSRMSPGKLSHLQSDAEGIAAGVGVLDPAIQNLMRIGEDYNSAAEQLPSQSLQLKTQQQRVDDVQASSDIAVTKPRSSVGLQFPLLMNVEGKPGVSKQLNMAMAAVQPSNQTLQPGAQSEVSLIASIPNEGVVSLVTPQETLTGSRDHSQTQQGSTEMTLKQASDQLNQGSNSTQHADILVTVPECEASHVNADTRHGIQDDKQKSPVMKASRSLLQEAGVVENAALVQGCLSVTDCLQPHPGGRAGVEQRSGSQQQLSPSQRLRKLRLEVEGGGYISKQAAYGSKVQNTQQVAAARGNIPGSVSSQEAPAAASTVVGVDLAAHHPSELELMLGPPANNKTGCWHDVQLMPYKDAKTGRQMLLLVQSDVTERVERELIMTQLNEFQIGMLDQMFPRHVLKHIAGGEILRATTIDHSMDHVSRLASSHDNVSIMFMDIVGFTTMSKQIQPQEVMIFLNALFTLFDDLVDEYEVYKVETAGDCYIVAGGLMAMDDDGFMHIDHHPNAQQGAEKVMAFAKALLRCAKTVNMPHSGEPTSVRVGIHTGPVVSGLIGFKLPKFSIFGDTMNTASRMESTCRPGCIQVTEHTRQLLQNHTFEDTGGVEIKGKGFMHTYLWDPALHPEEQYASPDEQVQEAAALLHHLNKAFLHAPNDESQPAAASPPRSPDPNNHISLTLIDTLKEAVKQFPDSPSHAEKALKGLLVLGRQGSNDPISIKDRAREKSRDLLKLVSSHPDDDVIERQTSVQSRSGSSSLRRGPTSRSSGKLLLSPSSSKNNSTRLALVQEVLLKLRPVLEAEQDQQKRQSLAAAMRSSSGPAATLCSPSSKRSVTFDISQLTMKARLGKSAPVTMPDLEEGMPRDTAHSATIDVPTREMDRSQHSIGSSARAHQAESMLTLAVENQLSQLKSLVLKMHSEAAASVQQDPRSSSVLGVQAGSALFAAKPMS